MGKTIKLSNEKYLDTSSIIHNSKILKNYLMNIPSYGENSIWKYWKFSNKFYIAIVPQVKLTYTNGSRDITLPFKVVKNKSAVAVLLLWEYVNAYPTGGLIDDSTVRINLGNAQSFNGDNQTTIIVIGEYV